jgi:SAM-dependent methyltransferase
MWAHLSFSRRTGTVTSDSVPVRRRNGEVIAEHVTLAGSRVLDVGCGDGGLVRLLTRLGALVVGLECSPKQLAKARGAEAVGDETYIEGVGEDLPFDDASMDAVIYFNSLRVAGPEGTVYVAEPLAEGPHFELTLPIHDETEVRAAAYAVIKDAGAAGLSEEAELVYIHAVKHKSFEAFRERMLTINPQRRDLFDANADTLRATFESQGEARDDWWIFDQPMRVNILRKHAQPA